MSSDDSARERLRAFAETVRTSGSLGKSVQINRLFDFLVESSLAARTPKEIEIAQEVFGLSPSDHLGQDATVRMSIHRLRKKLENLPPNREGEHLVLPRGEYRLQLRSDVDVDAAGLAAEAFFGKTDDAGTPRRQTRYNMLVRPVLAICVLGIIVLAVLMAWFWPLSLTRDARLASAFWKPLTHSAIPTALIVGDRYAFGEVENGRVVRQVVDPLVTSSEDLDRYLLNHKRDGAQVVDLNQFDLPAAMAPALVSIMPVLNRATGDAKARAITSSRFTTDMLKTHNIVYIGLLSDLRDLREPIFDRSGFALMPTGNAIVDRRSGRRFEANWADPSKERMLRRDYAYVASFPGPFGNRILVIAGMNDPGLVEVAQIVSRQADLAILTGKASEKSAFEALYEIRTFGPSGVANRLIIVRPTQAGRQWDATLQR
ncbi:hypothetical protein FB595_12722 [Sphingobium sp. AEW010]|nr:hypothetical protein FB595_12722 [Sphingobium sp. AEW010]TWD18321.1 hypothetical protein FB596_12822 [Sphingobium sp. AEW013]TWD20844.1 hypothetical protein FB594_12812 [Sphingobium sp. AEW001]